MMDWRQIPWPLWIYSAITLLGAILIEFRAHGPFLAKALYPIVMLVWLYFLLKGVRWIWIVTVGIYIVGLIPYLISGSLKWQGIALSLIGILLLLLPVTRQYFSKNPVAADA
jgi:hypothetical protein